MSRFKQIKDPSDDPKLAALYKEAVEAGHVGSEEGVPNNFITSQSERPDILAATSALMDEIVLKGLLPPTIKQMIAMTISMQADCRYCASVHTNALASLGVPEDVVKSCASDPELAEVTPPQRAILKTALKIARDPSGVTDSDFQNLRDFGLSEGEILEVAMMASCEMFLNIWARVSGIAIDGEEEG